MICCSWYSEEWILVIVFVENCLNRPIYVFFRQTFISDHGELTAEDSKHQTIYYRKRVFTLSTVFCKKKAVSVIFCVDFCFVFIDKVKSRTVRNFTYYGTYDLVYSIHTFFGAACISTISHSLVDNISAACLLSSVKLALIHDVSKNISYI